jgi:hypothetical protein
MVHVPHVHTRPPLFAGVFNPAGSVWACDCGTVWTLVQGNEGRTWREGRAPWSEPDTGDLASALRFIRRVANQHRRELGLKVTS